MDILELNLVKELTSVDQDPLSPLFLDLQKAQATVHYGRLLMTLEEYSFGLHMCRILEVFGDQKEVVTCQNGYYGLHFRATRGINKGGLISPTLLDFIVNNMVRN